MQGGMKAYQERHVEVTSIGSYQSVRIGYSDLLIVFD